MVTNRRKLAPWGVCAGQTAAIFQSAIFNFQSLISVLLLLICTCAYIRSFAPKLIDRNKEGKTSISNTLKRIEEMLHNKENEIYIHGLGASLNRAMVLALEVQKTFTDAISLNVTTSTVNVTDDLFPLSDEYEMGIRNRPLSAIQIHICRLQV
ncbi:unnamed protein product [Nippostrongylus brasiliensis]|uniref:Ribonuclease P protein subunit p20 (inferred by orthology to a human protein) n=1 Tax=Nippostrongylus brasiliensis TaxID=27835 RepID=A0A0N4Y5E3_NIPBR|nr:unnamed protein product [Nippostrongylus brasiliensis]